MRIKNDFVTNSSSTSYIVFIPKSFEVSDEEIIETTKEHFELDEEITKTYLINVQRGISKLKNENNIDEDEYQWSEQRVISEICYNHGFGLASFDSGPNDHKIISVSEERIKKLLINYTKPLENIKVKINEGKT